VGAGTILVSNAFIDAIMSCTDPARHAADLLLTQGS
jgi:hypothetical protein